MIKRSKFSGFSLVEVLIAFIISTLGMFLISSSVWSFNSYSMKNQLELSNNYKVSLLMNNIDNYIKSSSKVLTSSNSKNTSANCIVLEVPVFGKMDIPKTDSSGANIKDIIVIERQGKSLMYSVFPGTGSSRVALSNKVIYKELSSSENLFSFYKIDNQQLTDFNNISQTTIVKIGLNAEITYKKTPIKIKKIKESKLLNFGV